MISFKNDYSKGAHPRILNALMDSNMEQHEGYGYDYYTEKAIDLIKEKLQDNNVDVHLLVGGTQTNLTAISAFLRPFEAVIAPSTGHILTMETGAIEATGHKVISVPGIDGKLTASSVKSTVDEHTSEHMVKPKLVYISNPTEIGTIYKKSELEEISDVCKENNLLLYVDGARLGSALCSIDNDVTISELAKIVDAFYIGGTKTGALMGEALVICNDKLKSDFRFSIKQKGGLLAKGRILGIQFVELFKDDLYFELSSHANNMAQLLKKGIMEAGFDFFVNSNTNQIFPILPNSIIEKLQEKYLFYNWATIDENTSCIRLITCWAADEKDIITFINDLKTLTV
ncbi:MAG: threonine aldolase family protein [Clostridium sp.]